jgi:hypothetical protein
MSIYQLYQCRIFSILNVILFNYDDVIERYITHEADRWLFFVERFSPNLELYA